jgi:hypothetical protein
MQQLWLQNWQQSSTLMHTSPPKLVGGGGVLMLLLLLLLQAGILMLLLQMMMPHFLSQVSIIPSLKQGMPQITWYLTDQQGLVSFFSSSGSDSNQ